jgi:hypothetical protein
MVPQPSERSTSWTITEMPANPATPADETRRFAPGFAAERQGRWAAKLTIP